MRALREDKEFARLLQAEKLSLMPAFLEAATGRETDAMNRYVNPDALDEVIQAFSLGHA